MKEFKSKKSALRYAEENISKNDYEVVVICGVKTLLCSTSLPIERLVRRKIESIFSELAGITDNKGNSDFEDGSSFLGALTTEYILRRTKKLLGIEVVCAYMSY